MIRRSFRKPLLFGILLFAAFWIMLAPPDAKAGPLTYSVSSTGYEAQAVFTPVEINGQDYIQIVITNNETNTPDAGYAISSLVFTVTSSSDFDTSSSALSQISGHTITFGSNSSLNTTASVTDTGSFPDQTTHWGFNNGLSAMTLATVGNYADSHAPTHLIVSSSTTHPNPSLINNHQPSFYGSATFLITASGFDSNTVLTTSNITGVTFGYGTSFEEHAEVGSGSGSSPSAVPAPPSVVLFGFGGLVLFGLMARSRRRLIAAA